MSHNPFQTYSNGFHHQNYNIGNQYQSSINSNQVQYSPRQSPASVECESEASGLFVHPLDCGKFLTCDRGRTFIKDCNPGTVFNDIYKVCDWPDNVDCSRRNSNIVTNSLDGRGTDHGEGVINIRKGDDQGI